MFQKMAKESVRHSLRRVRTGTTAMALALAVAIMPASAHSQAAPPAAAQNKQAARPDLGGVWMSPLTSMEDPRWTVETRICYRCVLPVVEHLRMLLNDPKNADRPTKEIAAEVVAFNKKYESDLLSAEAAAYRAKFDKETDDPVLACKPVGTYILADGTLPFKIEQYDDKVIIRYEYFNSERTVYMDGRGHPADLKPSRVGHSIGWYDGDTLVIDTIGLEPALIKTFTDYTHGMLASEKARIIERYTRSKDGQSLHLELTLIDPRKFRRPIILVKTYLYDPESKMQDFECSVEPDYLKKLSAKRSK